MPQAQSLGQLIKGAREKRQLTRETAAKKLKISASYLGHLERNDTVPLSSGLLQRLQLKLGVPKRLGSLVERHNARAKRWYAAYRRRIKAKRS